MRIRVLVSGKVDDFLRSGVEHYGELLRRFCKLELLELKRHTLKTVEETVKRETEELKKRILPESVVLVLDMRGKEVSSEEFAEFLREVRDKGKDLTVLIGGPFGLDETALSDADYVLSLSKMTFTHGTCVLLMLEQIFRAFKIIQGESYHY